MENLATVPLLIIDDLGMRKLLPTAAEELLGIVTRRYERTSTLLRGSGADRIVGAIRSGVRYGDADYAAMTCRQIMVGFDRHGIGIANWRL